MRPFCLFVPHFATLVIYIDLTWVKRVYFFFVCTRVKYKIQSWNYS